MNEDQVEGKVKQGEGNLQELLGDVKEKASDLKEKAEDAFGDAKEKFEEAREEREADRQSEDEAARRDADTPPGPGASVKRDRSSRSVLSADRRRTRKPTPRSGSER